VTSSDDERLPFGEMLDAKNSAARDRRRSLSVTETDDGKVLPNCSPAAPKR
jgi:hypothetical protein